MAGILKCKVCEAEYTKGTHCNLCGNILYEVGTVGADELFLRSAFRDIDSLISDEDLRTDEEDEIDSYDILDDCTNDEEIDVIDELLVEDFEVDEFNADDLFEDMELESFEFNENFEQDTIMEEIETEQENVETAVEMTDEHSSSKFENGTFKVKDFWKYKNNLIEINKKIMKNCEIEETTSYKVDLEYGSEVLVKTVKTNVRNI